MTICSISFLLCSSDAIFFPAMPCTIAITNKSVDGIQGFFSHPKPNHTINAKPIIPTRAMKPRIARNSYCHRVILSHPLKKVSQTASSPMAKAMREKNIVVKVETAPQRLVVGWKSLNDLSL